MGRITRNQIEELRDEAAIAGDRKQFLLCELALDGDEGAWEMCEKAIDAKNAMSDGEIQIKAVKE